MSFLFFKDVVRSQYNFSWPYNISNKIVPQPNDTDQLCSVFSYYHYAIQEMEHSYETIFEWTETQTICHSAGQPQSPSHIYSDSLSSDLCVPPFLLLPSFSLFSHWLIPQGIWCFHAPSSSYRPRLGGWLKGNWLNGLKQWKKKLSLQRFKTRLLMDSTTKICKYLFMHFYCWNLLSHHIIMIKSKRSIAIQK